MYLHLLIPGFKTFLRKIFQMFLEFLAGKFNVTKLKAELFFLSSLCMDFFDVLSGHGTTDSF